MCDANWCVIVLAEIRVLGDIGLSRRSHFIDGRVSCQSLPIVPI
jgi:hypothetical protein